MMHLHICTLAHSKESPAGAARTGHAAANRASVRRMALSLAVPWARRRKYGIKDAMMYANQSREARLEMLTA